jgi:hypothetical protein
VYTCPTNHVVIIKSLFVLNQAQADNSVQVYAIVAAGNAYVALMAVELTALEDHHLDLWFVLEPGDYVSINYTQGPLNYWLSGAELPLPSA